MQKSHVIYDSSIEDCDAGQLLFYLMSHSIEGIKGNLYTSQVGLYSEGFKVIINDYYNYLDSH